MHTPDDRAFLSGFEATVLIEIDGLGRACFCHGSPRSDEECVTERTPAQRIHEFMAGIDASVVVTGHVHVSYDRVVDGIRMIGPGASGFHMRPGRAHAGRSSVPTSSSGAPTTTSRRRRSSCARRMIRASS